MKLTSPAIFQRLRWRSSREKSEAEARTVATPRLAFYRRAPRRAPAIALYLGSFAFALAYGATFATYAPYMMVMFTVPIAVLAMLVIWALPAGDYAPTQLLEPLYLAFFAALFLWPNYLAIDLPGSPWLTLLRTTGVPLALLLLVCVSVSVSFRRSLVKCLRTDPFVWRAMVAFVVVQLVSIALSDSKGGSVSKFIVDQTNWTAIFFLSCYLFSKPGFAERWVRILIGIALTLCFLGIWEGRLGRVPWAGHIPSFLAVQDEVVMRILTGSARASTGIYRVQATATTPLGLAEFLGLTAPFALHLALSSYSLLVRLIAAVTIPLLVVTIFLTNSRLGIVACLLSLMLYLLVSSALRWRAMEKSIFAPAIVLSYPFLFALAVASTFFIGHLRAQVWGGGAQQASTASRMTQWASGIPKILTHPFGHGIGRAADTLGFYNGPTLTIDSYYLSILLDYGILGFLIYYFIFVRSIWVGGLAVLSAPRERELLLLLPTVVSLANFVVIKAVFSQEDNHAFVFMMIGAVLALAGRSFAEEKARRPSLPETAPQPLFNTTPRATTPSAAS